jgi:nitrite reductase (NADH) large subunit
MPGVFALRSADDALAIRDWAKGSERAVVIGGGLLGLETGRGLTRAGLEVEVLEALPWLLPRQLDQAGAQILRTEVERLGMKVRVDVATAAIEGKGRPSAVVLKDGTKIPADLVIVSTGVRSTTKFLEASGLTIERGVVVDCDMRTNVPAVYAAGDVAEYEGRVWGIIPVAFAQAAAAAKSITGDGSEKACEVVPSNTLKITGIDVFSVGTFSCEDEDCREIVQEDGKRGVYRKVVVRGGRPIGAIVIGSRAGVLELQTMIEQGVSIDRWGDEIVREDFAYKKALEAAA